MLLLLLLSPRRKARYERGRERVSFDPDCVWLSARGNSQYLPYRWAEKHGRHQRQRPLRFGQPSCQRRDRGFERSSSLKRLFVFQLGDVAHQCRTQWCPIGVLVSRERAVGPFEWAERVAICQQRERKRERRRQAAAPHDGRRCRQLRDSDAVQQHTHETRSVHQTTDNRHEGPPATDVPVQTDQKTHSTSET